MLHAVPPSRNTAKQRLQFNMQQASLPELRQKYDLAEIVCDLPRADLIKQNVAFIVDKWTEKVAVVGFSRSMLKMYGDKKIHGLGSSPRILKSDLGKTSAGIFVIFDSLKLFAEDVKTLEIVELARRKFEAGAHAQLYFDTRNDFAVFFE